jgi:hypothetical protein
MQGAETRNDTPKRSSQRRAGRTSSASSKGKATGPKVLQKQSAAVKRRVERAMRSIEETASPSALKKSIDIAMILQNLSQYVVSSFDTGVQIKIAKSIQAAMAYDVTRDKVWGDISKECDTMKLYTCDPDPRTFVMNGDIVEGRGKILLSYETEVFPGITDEMSISVPARFKLELEDGEPRVTSVEI